MAQPMKTHNYDSNTPISGLFQTIRKILIERDIIRLLVKRDITSGIADLFLECYGLY